MQRRVGFLYRCDSKVEIRCICMIVVPKFCDGAILTLQLYHGRRVGGIGASEEEGPNRSIVFICVYMFINNKICVN